MHIRNLHAALLFVSLGLAAPAFAQSGPGDAQAAVSGEAAQRQALVQEIGSKWSNHIQEVYQTAPASWLASMATTFDAASTDTLQRAANAKTFTEMNNSLLGVTAAKLGDAAADLVFVPITPCRILDTRVPGTPIAANGTMDFDVTAISNYSSQGGDSSNCGGAGAAGSFAAAAINFTVVAPGAGGYITAYPYLGTRPLAATLNYNSGDIRGNLAIVNLDQGPSASEMTVYSFAQTHLVADLVGYYITPAATDLQCQDTANTVTSVAAGNTANVTAPACATGYTQTATNCETGSWDMPIVFSHAGTCSAKNGSGSAAELRASRTCCRVPGR